MSEAKFTSGEWLIEPTDGVFVYALNSSGANQFSLILSGNGNRGASAVELKVNAHLIAAAPEMYEMLDMIMNILNGDDFENEVSNSDIQNLLAKARGEHE